MVPDGMKEEFSVSDLTPRQREVVILIGSGRSYKAAAAQMKNKLVRGKAREDPPPLSPRTVERYAHEIQRLLRSHLPPMRAIVEFYHSHRDELEAVA